MRVPKSFPNELISLMQDHQIKNIVEAALLAAGRPLSLEQIAALFGTQTPETKLLREAVERLQEEYHGRGIMIAEVASGFRVQVRATVTPWVSRLWEERTPRYSRALLETLALIAYRQPITRGEIEDIRGVSVSTNIIRTLSERGWVRVVGHRDVPGRPAMYGTTREFLDYFGLKRLEDLPPLSELEAFAGELDLGLEVNHAQIEAEPQGDDSAPTAADRLDALEGAANVAQNDLGEAPEALLPPSSDPGKAHEDAVQPGPDDTEAHEEHLGTRADAGEVFAEPFEPPSDDARGFEELLEAGSDPGARLEQRSEPESRAAEAHSELPESGADPQSATAQPEAGKAEETEPAGKQGEQAQAPRATAAGAIVVPLKRPDSD